MENEEFLKLAKYCGLHAEYYMTNPPRLSGFVKVDGNRRFIAAMTPQQLWMLVELARNNWTPEMLKELATMILDWK